MGRPPDMFSAIILYDAITLYATILKLLAGLLSIGHQPSSYGATAKYINRKLTVQYSHEAIALHMTN